ncbi:MAG: general stress protein CsbD [Bacteroidales bacterium]
MVEDSFSIGGRWNHIRTRLKEKYPFLNENDLSYKEGEEEMFIGRLQRRLGGAKRERIIEMIKTL